MTQIKDLIERLEGATEGSRELDARVYAEAVGSDEVLNGCTLPEAIEQFPKDCGGICAIWGIPTLTTDLNAALALVEEKLGDDLMAWHVGFSYNGGPYDARLFVVPDDIDQQHEAIGYAKTPALALILALLNSLKEGSNNG